jgi:hypothetical protein
MKITLLLVFIATTALAQTNPPATNSPALVSTNAAKQKTLTRVVLPPGYEAVAGVQKKLDAVEAESKRINAEYRATSERNHLVRAAGGKPNQTAVLHDYNARMTVLNNQKAALELQMYDLRARYKVPAAWPPKAVPAKKTSGGKI